ncbi:dapper homolog 3-like isoform X2 [Panicum virgatum]|uniref:CSC1/OSCA1-like cytosolic domain-containing protein n=1 Tax=Panicum virgatum TaxID=38727 RepID=A0A8T0RJL1_PANVG|nr:dapper homolog 3-like isoform X2 [Panicum virgatum]KAG2585206.1 hypothetical protein PVAP13_6KG378306 [Panicum virgatum]KAG2585207.1 hypothetical protein PVAP13_6KG378306 [Panicum virgatum]
MPPGGGASCLGGGLATRALRLRASPRHARCFLALLRAPLHRGGLRGGAARPARRRGLRRRDRQRRWHASPRRGGPAAAAAPPRRLPRLPRPRHLAVLPTPSLPPELPPAVVGRIRALPHGATAAAAVEAPSRRARRWRVASGQPSPGGPHPHRDQWLQYNLITLLHQEAEERKNVMKDPNSVVPAAFVSFRSRWGASVCAQTKHTSNPTVWLTEWAPEPRDVYWNNLSIPFISLTIRRFIKGNS